jgi:uncharacterized protein
MLRRNTDGDDRTGHVIAIMAKAPRPGHVKTRLASSLPPDQVVELYTCFLIDTLALARSLDGARIVLVCPPEDALALGALAGDGVAVVPQEGRGLAAGLESAFRLLIESGFLRVVALDSDSPHLPSTVLVEALAHLNTHDLVVGPCPDGGYYLVGASTVHPGLFDGPRMGTDTALAALLARAEARALSVARTREWYDVDHAGDLERLAADLHADPTRAPATSAFLLRLREES